MALALVLAALVGLLLGLVGGGGSMVMVPVLVYVAGLNAPTAVALSLPIVGLTSLVGAVARARQGLVQGRALLIFAMTGMVGVVPGSWLTSRVPAPILLLIFAALLFLVAWRSWAGLENRDAPPSGVCYPLRCATVGFLVGVLTGFLGVGGGFVLVPALRRFANLTMPMAAATSLGIIAWNSAAGALAHWASISRHLPLAAAFTGMALLGLAGGLLLAGRLSARRLEQIFAGFAFGVGVLLVVSNLRFLLTGAA